MIVNQINELLASFKLPPVLPQQLHRTGRIDENNTIIESTPTPCHGVLDILDRHCGIITRYRLDGSAAPVGERVRRLERHKYMHTSPPFFWLGAETEELGAG